ACRQARNIALARNHRGVGANVTLGEESNIERFGRNYSFRASDGHEKSENNHHGPLRNKIKNFPKDVLEDDDIAPQPAATLGKYHATIRHGKNILPQIGVAASAAIPVFAGVNSNAVFLGKPRGDAPTVVSFARGLVGV